MRATQIKTNRDPHSHTNLKKLRSHQRQREDKRRSDTNRKRRRGSAIQNHPERFKIVIYVAIQTHPPKNESTWKQHGRYPLMFWATLTTKRGDCGERQRVPNGLDAFARPGGFHLGIMAEYLVHAVYVVVLQQHSVVFVVLPQYLHGVISVIIVIFCSLWQVWCWFLQSVGIVVCCTSELLTRAIQLYVVCSKACGV